MRVERFNDGWSTKTRASDVPATIRFPTGKVIATTAEVTVSATGSIGYQNALKSWGITWLHKPKDADGMVALGSRVQVTSRAGAGEAEVTAYNWSTGKWEAVGISALLLPVDAA